MKKIAATLQLNSTMNPGSSFSENAITGETFIISNGDGTVANGNAGDDDSDPNFGSTINLFPNEVNFSVGSLTYDDAAATGSGTEVFTITGLDLSALWSADPNRTNTTGGVTVLSDISDFAIGQWLFDGPGGISFGALDAADTVTTIDGVVSSVDLAVTTAFSTTDGAFNTVIWNGTFSITGADLSYQINDTQNFDIGFGVVSSTLQANLTGTVDAIPEPSTLTLLGLGCAGLTLLRRRSVRK